MEIGWFILEIFTVRVERIGLGDCDLDIQNSVYYLHAEPFGKYRHYLCQCSNIRHVGGLVSAHPCMLCGWRQSYFALNSPAVPLLGQAVWTYSCRLCTSHQRSLLLSHFGRFAFNLWSTCTLHRVTRPANTPYTLQRGNRRKIYFEYRTVFTRVES